MTMSPSEANDLNLHEVEDYSSEITHDQLPSVEEARFAAGVTLRKATSTPPSRKKFMYLGLGLVALTLLIIMIAVPVSNHKEHLGSDPIGNNVGKAVDLVALNGKHDFKDDSSYQAHAKRWLLQDKLVEDYTYDQLQQRYAMYCLHLATNPASWVAATGWKRKGVPECNWYGVTCNPTTELVTRINLSNNGLQGEIPPEVSLIPNLTVLNLHLNGNLTGSVPQHVCDLQTEHALDIKVDCAAVVCTCCSNCAEQQRNAD